MGGSPKELDSVVEPRCPSSPDLNGYVVKEDSSTSLVNGIMRLEMEDDPKFFDIPLIEDDDVSQSIASNIVDVVVTNDACPVTSQRPPAPRSPIRHVSDDSLSSVSDSAIRAVGTKSVAFANITIREYPVVIGDHPCCSMGCPLSLGWEYIEPERPVSLDEYEAHRPPRRSRQGLRTTWDERRQMLSDVSDVEVKRAVRRSYRERSCRSRTSAKFFQDLPQPPPFPTLEDNTSSSSSDLSSPQLISATENVQ